MSNSGKSSAVEISNYACLDNPTKASEQHVVSVLTLSAILSALSVCLTEMTHSLVRRDLKLNKLQI